MNLLSIEEKVRLEELLKEGKSKPTTHFINFKSYEILYLKRAKKFPLSIFSFAISYQIEHNLDTKNIINFLSKKYNTTEKEIENRIKEVKKTSKTTKNQLNSCI